MLNLTFGQLFSQSNSVEAFEKEYVDWYNKDYKNDKITGASVDKAYELLLKDLTPEKTVIVAVIDGGVDINHEDLEGKIWFNEDEIANNGIDDDNNGYIDDINGWNYLGNSNGDNISFENMEITRIVKSQNEESEFYKEALDLYNNEYKKYTTGIKNLEKLENNIKGAQDHIQKITDIEVKNRKDLKNLPSGNTEIQRAVKYLKKMYKRGISLEELEDYLTHCHEQVDYYLNKEFSPREMVGDDPTDITDTHYGNNIVNGPTSFHGTFVAGIIAANRNNDIGINGVATNVKIMALRVVPDGDERDKDVALAIRYAVDNGADIINMSFGKTLSPEKRFVDDAVKYAEEKGVLLVHSAGNDGSDNDSKRVYPNCHYLDGGFAKNWITIGASAKARNKEIAAVFSNYGKESVDLFAPGVDIVSLDTMNTYKKGSGTSFSSPVVSGVAALVLTYYPHLRAEQLIDILTHSIYPVSKPKKVLKPNDNLPKREKVKFSEICANGGIVNAYNALNYAKENYSIPEK